MHSHSHSYSHITSSGHGYTHARAPPPASPTSPSSSHASRSFSLPFPFTLDLVPKARLQVSSLSITNPVGRESPPFPNSCPMDDVSDDEYETAFNGSSGLGGAHLFHSLPRYLNTITSRYSKPGAKQSATQAVMGKPITTNNLVTKLY